MHRGELKQGMTVWAYRPADYSVTEATVKSVWGFPSDTVDLVDPDGLAFECGHRGCHRDRRLAQLAAREHADREVRFLDGEIREMQKRQQQAAAAFARLTDELVGADDEPVPAELGGEA